MFDFLKKKINNFTSKLTEKLKEKQAEETEKIIQEAEQETKTDSKTETAEEIPETVQEKLQEAIQEKALTEAAEKETSLQESRELKEEKAPEEPASIETAKEAEEKQTAPEKEIKQEKETEINEELKETLRELRESKGRELEAKQRATSSLKSFLLGAVKIDEKDLEEFLSEFELSLLESDVDQETAQEIIKEIKKELIGRKLGRGENLTEFLKKEIKTVLEKIMKNEEINLMKKIEGKKPFIILMLGPNGAGKTTSIAKLTNMLQEKGKKVVLASADTFRAGAIEQIETHAKRLGTRVIRHDYKADPAAVAFDAVKAAMADKADVVLIDSAGRQETTKNLMEELKKIIRVAKPDLKIFVGEALSGNTLLEQATKFNEELGLDGFILTKIDTDAKGGTSISLLHKLKKPIIYVGTGQEYKDFQEFHSRFILDRIIN